MDKGIHIAVLLAATACNNDTRELAKPEQVDDLNSKIAVLEAKLATVQGTAAETATILEQARGTLTAATAFFAVARIDEDGDVIFEGVNVYIQDGGGETCQTNPPYSSKGNLIIGYDEDRTQGTCSGGANDGNTCTGNQACTGRTCDFAVVSEKTGSHNLVVGKRHTYTSCGGIVAGDANTISAQYGVCAGIGNTVSGVGAAIAGGLRNTASGDTSVVIGGADESASGPSEIAPQ
ncbi:MAG: hypothetical protein A2289_00305 [Deltaproteobacteria bacterium RIFOXYA12_FULL_58_15]|nr:MAG: hypothetical protein A2289_00305 [Deltaproteobacteria bacterium RIFOXYA12_FULL_58_15]